ncbi:hypothetical protein DFH06DRAFT_1169915 [Mycena polygramma]|nr:hypothetical protein DFH06DRAFT_1169915 [Mycena polygramma]
MLSPAIQYKQNFETSRYCSLHNSSWLLVQTWSAPSRPPPPRLPPSPRPPLQSLYLKVRRLYLMACWCSCSCSHPHPQQVAPLTSPPLPHITHPDPDPYHCARRRKYGPEVLPNALHPVSAASHPSCARTHRPRACRCMGGGGSGDRCTCGCGGRGGGGGRRPPPDELRA